MASGGLLVRWFHHVHSARRGRVALGRLVRESGSSLPRPSAVMLQWVGVLHGSPDFQHLHRKEYDTGLDKLPITDSCFRDQGLRRKESRSRSLGRLWTWIATAGRRRGWSHPRTPGKKAGITPPQRDARHG
jgi:hypothetical protein